jgi:hypothetical protein
VVALTAHELRTAVRHVARQVDDHGVRARAELHEEVIPAIAEVAGTPLHVRGSAHQLPKLPGEPERLLARLSGGHLDGRVEAHPGQTVERTLEVFALRLTTVGEPQGHESLVARRDLTDDDERRERRFEGGGPRGRGAGEPDEGESEIFDAGAQQRQLMRKLLGEEFELSLRLGPQFDPGRGDIAEAVEHVPHVVGCPLPLLGAGTAGDRRPDARGLRRAG